MGNKFAVNSTLWSSHSAIEDWRIFERAQSIGFQGLEFPIRPFIDEMRFSKLRVHRIRSIIQSYSLIPIIAASGSIEADVSSSDFRIRQKGIALLRNSIDICRDFGGTIVAGALYGALGTGYHLNKSERKKSLSRIATGLREAARFARDRGVAIALEPVCRYRSGIINTVEQGKELLDMIGTDEIGLLLDTFHMNIEEKSLYESILYSGRQTFHFHVCENDRGPPGSGHLDWTGIKNALNKIHYSGWIVFESFNPFDKTCAERFSSWRSFASSQDALAHDALAFLQNLFASS